nr:myb-like protein I [Malus domestica]
MVSIKLRGAENYLSWSALFGPIFRRYKLIGIIDCSEPCPAPFLCDSNGNRTSTPNPAYESWYEKDQNILIWLNSTLSEDILPFTKLKELSTALAKAGAPVSDRDLITIILNGLPDDFEAFVDAVNLCVDQTSVDELHGLLLSKEISIARKKKVIGSPAAEPWEFQGSHNFKGNFGNFNRNFGSFGRNNGNFNRSLNNGGNRGNSGNNRNQNKSGSGGNRNNFNRNFGTFDRGSSSGGYHPCQLCGSTSHQAIDCYDRLNPTVQGRVPMDKLAARCAHKINKPSPSLWLADS